MGANLFTVSELATYTVCPQSWFLRRGHKRLPVTGREIASSQARKSWFEDQRNSEVLRRCAWVAYVLLFLLTGMIMAWDLLRSHQRIQERNYAIYSLFSDEVTIPLEMFLLLLVLGVIIVTWDLFERRRKRLNKQSGLGGHGEIVGIRSDISAAEKLPNSPGRKLITTSLMTSVEFNLQGTPDALLEENGKTIPALYKPLAAKVKDRHVIELLGLMLLLESNGQAPAYGILILGPKRRSVKIPFTAEKRNWITAVIDEMKAISAGVPPQPTPTPRKCRHCTVRAQCSYSAWRDSEGQLKP